MKSNFTNIMTIDLEEWFHSNSSISSITSQMKTKIRVFDNTKKILDLFEQNSIKATFFCLGYVAQKHPDLIKLIHSKGHEIASHGSNHKLVYEQTPSEFRVDVKESIDKLEQLVGEKVLGYRAPCWSITKKSLWALPILQDLGLKYDASVFPIKTFLYGIPDAPRFAYYPEVDGGKLNILEVPMSTLQFFGKRLPFSGGFYFRALPQFIINMGISLLNKQNKLTLVYLHPREIDKNCPRLSNLSFKSRLILYLGLKNCEKKFQKVLEKNKFDSMKNQLENIIPKTN